MYHAVNPGPRVLALDAAGEACSAAMVEGDRVVAFHLSEVPRGAPSILPGLVAAVIAGSPGTFAAVAVTVGPGSFTGLRAALSLAHGLALGAGVPVVGVTTAEATRALLPGETLPVWVVTDTRRGRVFLSRGDSVATYAMEDLPSPQGRVCLAGDAAAAVMAHWAANGVDAVLAPVLAPDARGAGLVGVLRHTGKLPPLEARPVYVDPPEARAPARLRPAPA